LTLFDSVLLVRRGATEIARGLGIDRLPVVVENRSDPGKAA